jgi:RHS repeat-associated protein
VAEAFGSVKIIEGDAEINLRLPGQYYDYESEGFYNFQRDYKSIAGRYLQQDPLGLSGGLNLYSYASQNPISKYDFLGLADKDMCARCEYKDKPDVCTIMCISLPVTWEVGCWKMELRCGEWNVVGFSTNTWTERPFAMVATFSCEYFDFLRKYPDPKYRPTIA